MRSFLQNCFGRRPKAVLLAEDHLSIQAIMKIHLECLGFDHVFTAMNGEEALEVYHKRKEEIALVISDIKMPGMWGDELFWRLRQKDEKIRMLLCSGFCNGTDVSQLLSAGLSGCIQKPFTPETIEFAIVLALADLAE